MQFPTEYLSKSFMVSATLVLLAGACQSQSPPTLNVEKQEQAGKITKVTLYRKQALVTREVAVAASETERDILVGSLPEQVVVESVFAEGTGNIQIRGVRVMKTASNRSQAT